MFRVYVVLILLLLGGCASLSNSVKSIELSDVEYDESEDMYALIALDAQNQGQFALSAYYFDKLYKIAPREEYLLFRYRNLLSAQQYEKIVDDTNYKSVGSVEVLRLRVEALAAIGSFEDAKKLAVELTKRSEDSSDYRLAGATHLMINEYKDAFRYYEEAYERGESETDLEQMAVILYANLNRKDDAVQALESYVDEHGCSETLCNRLASFYANMGNTDAVLQTYLKLQQVAPSPYLIEAISQIYLFKRDDDALKVFLEQHRDQDAALLKLEVMQKSYKRASQTAYRLYEQTADTLYLAQSAMFLYESLGDRVDIEVASEVIDRLKKSLSIVDNPMILNYLGYTMIENSIDIEEGMGYVRRALKIEPESVYYLDSLAWGHYKLGECFKAKEYIDRAMLAQEAESDEEVLSHKRDIEKCIKERDDFR